MESSQIGFFTAQPLMGGEGQGFAIFGSVHLWYLAYAIALIVALVCVYRRFAPGTGWGTPRRTMMLVVACVPLALLLSQDCIMIKAGVFSANWWPLHTCNFCELFALLYALRPNDFSGEVLSTLGVVGAICALLFPNWAYCPPWTWPVVCGFTEHALIVAFIAMLVFGGDFKPVRAHIGKPLAFLAVYLVVMYAFNQAFDTNFLFLNYPTAGSPLVGLADLFGNPGYIVPSLALLVAVFFGMYGVWGIVGKRLRAKR